MKGVFTHYDSTHHGSLLTVWLYLLYGSILTTVWLYLLGEQDEERHHQDEHSRAHVRTGTTIVVIIWAAVRLQ